MKEKLLFIQEYRNECILIKKINGLRYACYGNRQFEKLSEAKAYIDSIPRNMGIGIGSIVKVKAACDANSHLIGQIGKVREICNGHFGHVVQVGVKFPGYQGIHKFYPDALTIEYHTR